MSSQQLSPSGVAWGILLGPPGLRLVSPPGVWMAMYPVGGPRDWPLASLTGPRGSPGPQTPGSQPACDTGRTRLSARLLWRLSGDFSDSDSEDFEEAEGRYFRVRGAPLGRGRGRRWEPPSPWPVPFQLSQQSRCPDFFLFLCRLLSPVLKAFAQAAAFLHRGRLPDTGEARASCHPKERPNTVRGELCLRGAQVSDSLPHRVRLHGAAVPVLTGHSPGGRALR